MARLKSAIAVVAAGAIGVMMTACGSGNGTTPPPPQNYTLTVDSTNPASGVSITGTAGTTPYTETAAAGTQYTLTAPATASGNNFSSWTGCTSTSGTGNVTCNVTLNSNMTVTATYTSPAKVTPTVTVTPASFSITTAQSLSVTVTVAGGSGGATPTGSITLTSGSYSSPAATLSGGSASITIQAGSLATGTDTITATYAPDSGSSSTYNSATGTSASVTVTAPTKVTPTVTVSAPSSIQQGAAFSVTVTVNGTPTPTGSVVLSGSGFTSPSETLANGSYTVNVAANTWNVAPGTYTMTATYTPDSGSSSTYNSATGTSGNITVTSSSTLVNPTVTVQPSSGSVNTEQSLAVTVTVSAPSGSGDPTPTGSVVLSNGNGYTSAGVTLSSGSTVITVPAGSLPQGLNTLTATYTPDSGSSATYNSATGNHTVTVTLMTPSVAVTPQSYVIDDQQSLDVTVAVSAPGGDPVPTGSVVVSYGTTYSSAATALVSGSATVTIPAGTLPNGNDTLTGTYTPDSGSSGIYSQATGTSSAVTVGAATSVTVDQSSAGPATTDKILGVNLEAWWDVVGNASTVNAAIQGAGMKSIRWPGGSWSDAYHWGYQTGSSSLVAPYMCSCEPAPNQDVCTAVSGNNGKGWAGYSTFDQFAAAIPMAGGFDLALTANYGSNETCNGGGDPNEAAEWAAEAVSDGIIPSHITIGNEVYGSGWETDLHAKPNDPTTYAKAVTGADGGGGYYPLIKTASANTLVGVVVNPGNSPAWDPTVLSLAKGSYDFVEYHYYPQYGNVTSDYALVHTLGPEITSSINSIKQELSTAGEAGTPIYVGELGGNSANEGTQGWSITQGLFAGQVLGEAMNDGVSRLTWWDGFGNCQGSGNNSSNLYGWQNTWGAENIFSDAASNCPGEGSMGTESPTARAFQLFSYVAVNGENVLTATTTGDTTDVRAYAATHSGGTALVIFNLNATMPESVNITLNSNSGGQTSTSDMQVITYDKEIYDYTNVNCQADSVSTFKPYPCTYDSTHNYGTAVWAAPTTTDLGAQSLPYTLVLQPWSMNVVIIK